MFSEVLRLAHFAQKILQLFNFLSQIGFTLSDFLQLLLHGVRVIHLAPPTGKIEPQKVPISILRQ